MMRKYLLLTFLVVLKLLANADGLAYEQLRDNPTPASAVNAPGYVFKIQNPATPNMVPSDITVSDIAGNTIAATTCGTGFYKCYNLTSLLNSNNTCRLQVTTHYTLAGVSQPVINSVVTITNISFTDGTTTIGTSTTGTTGTIAPVSKNMSDIKPTGIAYYDAVMLNKLVTNSGFGRGQIKDSLLIKILEILSRYNQGQRLTAADTAALKNNLFLAGFMRAALDTINRASQNGISGNISFSDLSSALSTFATGTDITPYVQAIADFLAERMKEEVTTALIDRMKQMLDTVPELKYMLPNTYTTFTTTDPFLIPTMGQVYKQSFLKDIESSPYNFEAMVNSMPKYITIKYDPGYIAFISSYHAADLFSKGNTLPDVLQQIDELYGNDSADYNANKLMFQRSLRIARLVSDGIRSNGDTAHVYVNPKDLASLSSAEMKIFMGLLFQQDSAVFNNYTFAKPVGGDSNLTKVIYHNLTNFQKTLNRLVNLSVTIDAQVNAIKKIEAIDSLDAKQKQQKEITYFLRNCDVMNDVLDFGLSLPYFKNLADYRTSVYYTQWRPVVQDAISIAKAIPVKNYGLIVTSSVHAITKVVNNVLDDSRSKLDSVIKANAQLATMTKKQIKNKVAEIDKAIASAAPQPVIDSLKKLRIMLTDVRSYNSIQAGFKDLAGISKFVEKLSFFYNFITDMANADSSVAIKKILEKYADPPGSYKIKRNSYFSIALNAYPGLYTGVGLQSGVKPFASSVSGVTAPIGIAFSWCSTKRGTVLNQSTSSFSKKSNKPYLNKNGWSHSLFIAIIDVGAALNLKLSKDSVSLPNKVTVLQIFSPGIFYSLGIKGAPVSINVGGQLLPQLHQTISDKGQAVVDASNIYWVGGTLSVDIPVFHFVRKETRVLGY